MYHPVNFHDDRIMESKVIRGGTKLYRQNTRTSRIMLATMVLLLDIQYSLRLAGLDARIDVPIFMQFYRLVSEIYDCDQKLVY